MKLLIVLFAAALFAQDYDPFHLSRLKDYRAARSSSNNADLASNDDSKRPIPGETVVLADLQGPGAVTHIWLTVAASEYGWPRLLRLRIYYDGSAEPGVDVPAGDFFASGLGLEREVDSLMVRNSSSGRSRNCYWPMPFRKSCRITVTNEGRRRVSNLYYHVDWRKMPSLPADAAYFHAWYRQELPAHKGEPYTVLNVKGRGHYVGTLLNVIQTEPGWFGEGDDYFYVDGEKSASIQGTGTEDYFNDAWSLRVAGGPYAGVPVAEGTGTGSRMSAYRWHLHDPIPFTRSLRFDFEHAGWTYNANGSVRSAFEERADLFSSVAFWYQQSAASGLPEPPYGAARLPHGNARQIEVETLLPEVRTENGKASVQKEVFWSKDLLFFRAQGPGARIEIPFDIAEDGRYELLPQIAHAPDYGRYTVLVDGKPPSAVDLEHEPGANMGGAAPIDAYHTEVYVAEDHLIGWLLLRRGRHTVTFTCAGKSNESRGYNLGIDTLIVARIGSPEPVKPPVVTDPLKDLSAADPVVRGLAAVALRDKPLPTALPLLVDHLRDADENVRMMSAHAIARLGGRAAPAVRPLIELGRSPGQHVHVLRAVAEALGAIGPPAREALPLLRDLEKIPRVAWAASAAIRNVSK